MGRPGQPCCDRVEKDRGQHGRREARLTHRFTSGPSLLARLISRWRFRNVSTRWFRWENAATGVAGDAGCKVLRLKADGSTREEEERSSKGGSQPGGPSCFWISGPRDACHPQAPTWSRCSRARGILSRRESCCTCLPDSSMLYLIRWFFETLPLPFERNGSKSCRQIPTHRRREAEHCWRARCLARWAPCLPTCIMNCNIWPCHSPKPRARLTDWTHSLYSVSCTLSK